MMSILETVTGTRELGNTSRELQQMVSQAALVQQDLVAIQGSFALCGPDIPFQIFAPSSTEATVNFERWRAYVRSTDATAFSLSFFGRAGERFHLFASKVGWVRLKVRSDITASVNTAIASAERCFRGITFSLFEQYSTLINHVPYGGAVNIIGTERMALADKVAAFAKGLGELIEIQAELSSARNRLVSQRLIAIGLVASTVVAGAVMLCCSD
ncbi:MAG: hypothetical protein HY539_05415 [Deltaproteobacteria bacterium]|nr:hypothetical protein [Deltaproteobacteria bacterium]